MRGLILQQLVAILVGLLSPELLKKLADMLLDFVEDFVLGTKTDIDDMFVLPFCKILRKAFSIPDEDEG